MNNQPNLDPGKTEAERFLKQPAGTLPTNTATVVKRVSTLESKVTALENRQNLFIDHWTIASADVLNNKRNNNGVIEQYNGSAWVVVTIEDGDVWFDGEAVTNQLAVYNNAEWTVIPLSSESVYINRANNISYVWTGSMMTPASSVLSFATKEEAELGLSESDVMSPKTTKDSINYNIGTKTQTALDGKKILHGIESYTATTFNNTTKILTLPACTYWYQGVKVVCSANITINLTTLITAQGANRMYFVYFDDATGVLKASQNAWNLKTMCPLDAIFWNGTAGALTREKHNHTRDLDWHINAHTSIGARYISGLALGALSGNANVFNWSVASGSTADEDLIHTVDAHSQAVKGSRVWYQIAGGAWTFVDTVLPTSIPYIWNSGTQRVQHPIPATFALTDLATNRYIPIYVYANGGDKDRQIYFVLPTIASGTYTSATNARAANPPDLSALGWAQEAKLIHRIIVDGAGQPQATISTDDLRNVSSLPSGGTQAQTASAVAVTPPTGFVATNQQAFDNELSDMLWGRSVALGAGNDINMLTAENFSKTCGAAQAFTISNPIVGKSFYLTITGGTLAVPTFTGYTTTWILNSLVIDYVPASSNILVGQITGVGTIKLYWSE